MEDPPSSPSLVEKSFSGEDVCWGRVKEFERVHFLDDTLNVSLSTTQNQITLDDSKDSTLNNTVEEIKPCDLKTAYTSVSEKSQDDLSNMVEEIPPDSNSVQVEEVDQVFTTTTTTTVTSINLETEIKQAGEDDIGFPSNSMSSFKLDLLDHTTSTISVDDVQLESTDDFTVKVSTSNVNDSPVILEQCNTAMTNQIANSSSDVNSKCQGEAHMTTVDCNGTTKTDNSLLLVDIENLIPNDQIAPGDVIVCRSEPMNLLDVSLSQIVGSEVKINTDLLSNTNLNEVSRMPLSVDNYNNDCERATNDQQHLNLIDIKGVQSPRLITNNDLDSSEVVGSAKLTTLEMNLDGSLIDLNVSCDLSLPSLTTLPAFLEDMEPVLTKTVLTETTKVCDGDLISSNDVPLLKDVDETTSPTHFPLFETLISESVSESHQLLSTDDDKLNVSVQIDLPSTENSALKTASTKSITIKPLSNVKSSISSKIGQAAATTIRSPLISLNNKRSKCESKLTDTISKKSHLQPPSAIPRSVPVSAVKTSLLKPPSNLPTSKSNFNSVAGKIPTAVYVGLNSNAIEGGKSNNSNTDAISSSTGTGIPTLLGSNSKLLKLSSRLPTLKRS